MKGLIVRAGRALYGPHWRNPLARDLGVSDRSLRRWAAGEIAVPSGVLNRLHDVISERVTQLHAVQRVIWHTPEPEGWRSRQKRKSLS